MAIITIPIQNAEALGNFYFTADLDGSIYEFNFQYNERDGFWYFDLLDDTGEYVRAGIKVTVNWPLLRNMAAESNPPGEILFLDTRDEPADPGLSDLGLNALLTYVDESDL